MKLVPLAEYTNLLEIKKLFLKDQNSTSNLNTIDDNIPDDIKVAMLASTAQKLKAEKQKALEEEIDSKPTSEIIHIANEEKSENLLSKNDWNLLEALPKSFIPPAATLMRHLRKHPGEIDWKITGEVIIRGVVQKESNIVELLSYVLRPNLKWSSLPVGTNRFLYILRSLNIPSVILGRHIRNMMGKTTTETLKRRLTQAFTPVIQKSPWESYTQDQDDEEDDEISFYDAK